MPNEPFELEGIDDVPLDELGKYHDLQGAPAESAGERNSRYFRIGAIALLAIVLIWGAIQFIMSIRHRLENVSSGYKKGLDMDKGTDQSLLAPPGMGESFSLNGMRVCLKPFRSAEIGGLDA